MPKNTTLRRIQVTLDPALARELDHLRADVSMTRPEIVETLIRRGMPASAEELLAEVTKPS